LLRTRQKQEENLKHCKAWQQEQHLGILLQSHAHEIKPGMTELIVKDWENGGVDTPIPINSKIVPQRQAEPFFKRSKKLKSGIPYAERCLQNTDKEIEACKEKLQDLQNLQTLPKAPVLKKTPLPKPYHVFTSASGMEIWVGKSAKDNDKLTFTHAKGGDWWLHVNEYAGAHVVIRTPKNQEPDQETFKDAIQLALNYSKAKGKGEAEICITQCKHVARIGKKGSPGSVHVSKHKVILAKADKARLQELRHALHQSSLNR
jgi:predicted ribosome quality control (RQC) complex YloA/Tae2 family protein